MNVKATNRCLLSPGFADWDWLDACMERMAIHPRVSDKMKMRLHLFLL